MPDRYTASMKVWLSFSLAFCFFVGLMAVVMPSATLVGALLIAIGMVMCLISVVGILGFLGKKAINTTVGDKRGSGTL